MVSDLALLHEWRSVLNFYDEYRSAQAVESFSWGADMPYLREKLVFLPSASTQPKFKGKAQNSNKSSGSLAQSGRNPSVPSGFCRSFNTTGACTYGQNCKFRHVCFAVNCGEPHLFCKHPN